MQSMLENQEVSRLNLKEEICWLDSHNEKYVVVFRKKALNANFLASIL